MQKARRSQVDRWVPKSYTCRLISCGVGAADAAAPATLCGRIDADMGNAEAEVRSGEMDLSDAERHAILAANARRLMHLEPPVR